MINIKTVVAVLVVAILVAAIPVTTRLTQQPKDIEKSQAAQPTFGSISVGKTAINLVNGSWESIPLTVTISVPGADNSKTVAGVYITKTENVSAGVGWTAIGKFYGSNGVDSFSWTPPLYYGAGSYTFGLFYMDQNTVLDIIQTSTPVEFRTSTVSPTPTPISVNPTPTPISGGTSFDGAECQETRSDVGGPVFYETGTTTKAVFVQAGKTYDVVIRMYNKDLNNPAAPLKTWTPGVYRLGFPGAADRGSTVNINPDNYRDWWDIQWPSTEHRLDLDRNVPSGSFYDFKVKVTAKKGGTQVPFYWRMVHENVAWFGGECATAIDITASSGGVPQPPSGTTFDAALCNAPAFLENGQVVTTGLLVGKTYDVQIKMDNKDPKQASPPTWIAKDSAGNPLYRLGFPTAVDNWDPQVINDVSNWDINWPDPSQLRLNLERDVPPNTSYTFNIKATPAKEGLLNFYWRMVHEGVAWFGGACLTQISTSNPVCPKASEPGTKLTCGFTTYDTCQDDQGRLDTDQNFCTGSAKNFRCYYSKLPEACISWDTDNPYNYSCSACSEPPIEGQGTLCYLVTDDLLEKERWDEEGFTNCSDSKAIPYDQHPETLPYTFTDQTAGLKTIYTKFIAKDGSSKDVSKAILYKPAASLTNITCSFAPQGTATNITITGTNLGSHTQLGSGGITVGGKKTQVTWTEGQTEISIQVPERLQSEIPILFQPDGGTVIRGSCVVNLATLGFTANIQCRPPGNLGAEDVRLQIYENLATSSGTPKPIITQEIILDRDGVPQRFTPQLESGKSYTLIIKAPGTVARKVVFTATNGTVIVPGPIILPVGNIYPVAQLDSQINAFDKSELIRQWTLVSDVTRTGDFNLDKRVNSIDYACMRPNLDTSSPTHQDETYTPVTDNASTNRKFSVSGKVFFDDNLNKTFDSDEAVIAGVVVKALRPTTSPETPGQTLTAAQAATATVLGQATTNSSGNYSMDLTPPNSILNLVMWVDPGSVSGQGGQTAIGIGAIPDYVLETNPLVMNIAVTP